MNRNSGTATSVSLVMTSALLVAIRLTTRSPMAYQPKMKARAKG